MSTSGSVCEDLLEHLVLDQGSVGEHAAPLHHLLQARGAVDLFVEADEERRNCHDTTA